MSEVSHIQSPRKDRSNTESSTDTLYLAIGVIIAVILLGVVIFLILRGYGVFDKPNLELIGQHVRVETSIQVDMNNIEEPYVLTVNWVFPEGSVLRPNDILDEKYYKLGFYLLKDRDYLLDKTTESWKIGVPNPFEVVRPRFAPRDELLVYLNKLFFEEDEIPEDYKPFTIVESFRTEDEMLKFKEVVTDMRRWDALVERFIGMYEDEKARLEKLKEDVEKYNILGNLGRMYADTVQITAPYFLLTVS